MRKGAATLFRFVHRTDLSISYDNVTADQAAAEWHRQQYRDCFAPFPGQYPFFKLLETQVKQHGIDKGLERAPKCIEPKGI